MSETCERCERSVRNQNQLELISMVQEFNDLHEFMKDEDVDTALARTLKLIAKPDVPPAAAATLVIELQALATKFAILATYYQTIGKGNNDHTHKKNVCYTLREALTKMADALKYGART